MNETEIIAQVIKIDERSKSNENRIEAVEKKQSEITDLIVAVKSIANREERLEGDVKEIKSDVKSLKEIPAKRWEAVVEKIVLVIVGAIIAFILGRVGI